MKIVVDGKEIEVANDVKIIWSRYNGKDVNLHVTATNDGIVLDVFDQKETLISTGWLEVTDLIDITQ